MLENQVENLLRSRKSELHRRHKRIESRIKEYENEDKLSKHGMWSKGYWIGKRAELEETIDFIDEVLTVYDMISDQKFRDTLYGLGKSDLKPYSLQDEIQAVLDKPVCDLLVEN